VPGLPAVEQTFEANTRPFVDGVEAAIQALRDFDTKLDETILKVGELQAALDKLDGKTINVNLEGVPEDIAEVEELRGAIDDLPVAHETDVNVTGIASDIAGVEALRALLDSLPNEEHVGIDVGTVGGLGTAAEAAALDDMTRSADNLSAAVEHLDENAASAQPTLRDMVMQAVETGTQLLEVGNQLVDTARSVTEVVKSLRELGTAADTTAHDVQGLDTAARDATVDLENIGHATAASVSPVGDAARAIDDYRSSLDSATKSTLLYGTMIDQEQESALTAAQSYQDVAGAVKDAGDAAAQADQGITSAGNATRTATHYTTLWGTALSALTSKVQLFGGAFGQIPLLGEVAGWHLLADAIVETTAVWVPATLAFAAFGAAATPTVQAIYGQMKNLYTISQATGDAMPGLSGGFQKVAAAVQPQVYQLFGEALNTINHNGTAFSTMATGAGNVLDQLGARIEVAVTSGNGLNTFATTAVNDLGKLTNSLGNVTGIFGDLLKVVPGYANVLLTLGDNATKGAEGITAMAEPLLKVGLAAHGAILYTGLLGTAFASLARGGATMVGNLAEKLGTALLATDAFGAAGEKAGTALLGFSADAAEAAALPWGWIAIAAAGLGVLAYKMLTAKDATQQWLGSMQQTLAQASAGTKGLTLLQEDQAAVSTRLALAQQHYGLTAAQATKAMNTMGGSIQVTGREIQGGAKSISELSAGQQTLSDQATLYTDRLGKLGAQYGSVGAAEGLLTAAGVTMGQMLDKNSEEWAQIQARVAGMVSAYREMGQQSGTLESDLNALTISGSSQVSAMSNLNKAWDTTIGIVSGGQNAFISFEQSLSQTAVGSAKLNGSIGSLDTAMKATGASMTGLNPASLGLRSAWQGAYGAGAQLIDALRMMSSVSPGGFPSITQAMKDTIAQLMPLGKQSEATRTEMVQLAQEVNPNVTNFKQLTTWLGNTHGAAQNLNSILAKSGTNLENLAQAAAKLSDALQSDVTQQMAQAKLAANHTDQAITAVANAFDKAGSTAQQKSSALKTLYGDLRQDGYNAQQAAALIDQMTGQIIKIPKSWTTTFHTNASATQTAVEALHTAINNLPTSKIINVQIQSTEFLHTVATGTSKGAHGGMVGPSGIIPGFAGGGILPGFEPGVDRILAALSPGEAVLNPYAVRMLGAEGVNWLNRAAEHGGTGTGAGIIPGGAAHGTTGTAQPVHIYLDGKEIFASVKQHSSVYGTRNAGSRTGLLIPGQKVGSGIS